MTGYLGTLLRYLCLGGAVASAMVLFRRLLRRLGCREETAAGYAFILPWLLGLLLLWVFPMGLSLFLSFTRYGVLSAPRWVGLAHYAAIFSGDPVFLDAVRVTVTFAVLSVSLGILSSLLAALLLSLEWRLMGFWRVLYYLPSVIPAVSTALLWRWIFVPEGGLANGILQWLGLPQPGWFSDPAWVIPAFVIMSLQGAFGNNMVIFLARLKGIDAQLHEAAMMDGAGVWSRFWRITLPQLTPVLFYHLVMGIIGSLQVFTQPMFVRTPGRSGLFYAVHVYRTGWEQLRMGHASALAWVLFVALVLLTLLVFRTARRWVSYEESDVQMRTRGAALQTRGWRGVGWYVAVVAGAIVMLVPVLWMVSTSLKDPTDLFAIPPRLLSLPLRLRNYVDAWGSLPFWRFLGNSLFVTVLPMFASILTAALAAYGFARFRFPGKKLLYGILLSTLMVPGVVLMIPVFLIWRALGLVGTFDPLVIPGWLGGSALFVFLIHQFMRTLPRDLEDAARLDGASHATVFFRIVLPLCKPVLLAVALISFQSHWNDFLGPLLYLNRMEHYTMTMGLHFFQGSFMGEAPKWHWMMAVTTLMALPTILLFAFAQKAFLQGLAGSMRRGVR